MINELINDINFIDKRDEENLKIISLSDLESLKYLNDVKVRKKIDELNRKIYLYFNDYFSKISKTIINNVRVTNEHFGCIFDCTNNNVGNVYKLSLNSCQNILSIKNTKSIYELQLRNCDHIKDVCNLNLIRSIDITFCKNIRDVGSLRDLKILKVHERINGIQYLKNLDEIIIMYDDKYSLMNNNHKIKKQLAKLKKINPTIKIKETRRRIMSGMGVAYSN